MHSVPIRSNLRLVSVLWHSEQLAMAWAPNNGNEICLWISAILFISHEFELWHLAHSWPTVCWCISMWQDAQLVSDFENSSVLWHCLQSINRCWPSSKNIVLSWLKSMESLLTTQLWDVWHDAQLRLNSFPCGDWACAPATAQRIKKIRYTPLLHFSIVHITVRTLWAIRATFG